MNGHEDGMEENGDRHEKSRTRIKNEDRELQKLGERLLTLSHSQLAGIDIPQELREAVIEAGKLKSREAKHRHAQYIGTIMRNLDPSPIIRAFELLDAGVSLSKKKETTADAWMKNLMEDDSAVEMIVARNPETDRQKLRQLTRNVKKAPEGREKEKLKKHLLRYLHELSEN